MKILTVDKIREADAFTIKNEPIASIDLMERAASLCFQWIISHIPEGSRYLVFCGAGNNGGDGLALARMLKIKGFPVKVYLTGRDDQRSADCRTNEERWLHLTGTEIISLSPGQDFPEIQTRDIVIDALLGSGLSRPVEGFLAELINHINGHPSFVISIDLPSGLLCDQSNQTSPSPVVKANVTLTFAVPKLSFLFPENERFVGDWQVLDIGLMPSYFEHAGTDNYYVDHDLVKKILRPRNKFSHKGNFGHALLIAGALGKMGAAVLAARACLRSGPGLVTVRVPTCGTTILQTAVPEAMLSIEPNPEIFCKIPDLHAYSSLAIGPGIGQDPASANALKVLIQEWRSPMIIDADAINILADNKTWLSFLPKGCILTPHIKEFERLIGKSSNDFERNRIQRDFSLKYQAYVVLKGAYTAITTPERVCYFNSTGNPGMATGGSGDVLTGILNGLLAQGYSPLESCLLGVYLHGLAGDYASAAMGQEALTAGDLIHYLGKTFQSLYGKF